MKHPQGTPARCTLGMFQHAEIPRTLLTFRRSDVASHGKPGQIGYSLLGGHSEELCLEVMLLPPDEALRCDLQVDAGIVACFFDERGLSILIRALLTYQLPRSIKLQVYQSTCMIIQSSKDVGLRCFWPVSNRSPLYPDVPRANKMNDLVVWYCYVFGLYCCVQLQQLCDHFVMGWK